MEYFRLNKASFYEERGQGLLEYALIFLFIAIVVIVALTPLGETTYNLFETIRASFQ